MHRLTYAQCVAEARAYISLTIDLEEPIELSDFAALFASVSGQFDDFLREFHPDLAGEARIFIREVREGSIVAALVPMVLALVETMDAALVVKQFSEWVSGRVGAYVAGKRLPQARKSDLAEITDMVRAVANNRSGQAKLEAVWYAQDGAHTEMALCFTTPEARHAVQTLEAHKADLDRRQGVDHENVLMVFFQANLKDTDIGKRSGEQVVIEAIDSKPKPLVYASDLARERIKAEFDDAIFKKGFFVDVNVETHQGRKAAYKVTNVRQIIDLPD